MEKKIKITEPGMMELIEDVSLLYYDATSLIELINEIINDNPKKYTYEAKLIIGLDNDGNAVYYE